MKTQHKRKGFTLVELLVVIAILAILATVSVVGYTAFIKRAHESNAESEAAQIREIIMAAVLSGEKYYLTSAEDTTNGICVEADTTGYKVTSSTKKIAATGSITDTDLAVANADLSEILIGGNYLTVDSTNNKVIYHYAESSLKVEINLKNFNEELNAQEDKQ